MAARIPGFYPAPEEAPIIKPPWLDELPRDVIDTRTQLVGRGLPQRSPDEAVFFPGRPPRHGSAPWRVLLDNGQRISVTGPIVFGRKPEDVEGYSGAELITLTDPGKTVSKSHAIVLPHGEGLFVLDLNSTNGVAVVANGSRKATTPNEFANVPVGAVIELGSYLLGVERD